MTASISIGCDSPCFYVLKLLALGLHAIPMSLESFHGLICVKGLSLLKLQPFPRTARMKVSVVYGQLEGPRRLFLWILAPGTARLSSVAIDEDPWVPAKLDSDW